MISNKGIYVWYLPVLLVLAAIFIFFGLKYLDTSGNEQSNTTSAEEKQSTDNTEQQSADTSNSLSSDQVDYLAAGKAIDAGDYAAAIKSLDSAIAKNPNNPSYYSLKAQAQLLLGQKDAAKETLQAGLTVAPDDDLLNSKLDVLNNEENLAPADQETPRL